MKAAALLSANSKIQLRVASTAPAAAPVHITPLRMAPGRTPPCGYKRIKAASCRKNGETRPPSLLTGFAARTYPCPHRKRQEGGAAMADIVFGIATSHTPMLNAPAADWPRFIERDRVRPLLDTEGRPVRFEELLSRADPAIADALVPDRIAARHAAAQRALARLAAFLAARRPDVLIVIGDDHKELYDDDHMPAFLIYYGERIPNRPLTRFSGPDWARRATARYYEERGPRLRLCPPPPDGRTAGADRAACHQHLFSAQSADAAALLQARTGPARRRRGLSGAAQSRRSRLGRAQPFRRRRGARSRRHRRARPQGRGGALRAAARKAQFRQFRDPQLDLSRRRRRTPSPRMVALRAGLAHAGRHRHRARLCDLDMRRTA